MGSSCMDESEVQPRERGGQGSERNMNLRVLRVKGAFRAMGLEEITEGGNKEKPGKGTQKGLLQWEGGPGRGCPRPDKAQEEMGREDWI